MSQDKKNHFTTGEFATLCGVGRHTLLHYDQIGIFSPAVKGDNGYRYYSLAQLDVFYVIYALRELGMPLGQIKRHLDTRSPAALVNLLAQEEAALAEKLDKLSRMQGLIRRKREMTAQAMALNPAAIFVEQWPQRVLVVTPLPPNMKDKQFTLSVVAHLRYCEEHGIFSPNAVGAILPAAAARAGKFGGYTYYSTQLDELPPPAATCLTLPAGRYLTACHTGGYDTTGEGYIRLLHHARAHRLALGEVFLEDVLLDELSVRGEDNYLLRLSILLEEP